MTRAKRGRIRPEHVHFLPESARKAEEDASDRRVPVRGLLISIGAFLAALVAGTFFRDTIEASEDLVWSLAIIPALLLAYHRGWKRVTLTLAAGLAVLLSTYFVGYTLSFPIADWPPFLPVISAYIAIALASGWISEAQARVDELKAKESELLESYVVLQASHEAHKSAQLQLIQVEKLESVGLLAAGVAHEVKNPLMTLLTGVQYLKEFAPPEDDEVKLLLNDMWLAVKRADTVIKGLLDFSRERELVLNEENVNDMVKRTIRFVKHELDKKRINVTSDFEEELPLVTMDRFKVQQVLVNLLTNATHAMPEGGALTVRTTRGSERTQATAPPGAHVLWDTDEMRSGVEIEVQDTGPGIPEESLTKIFVPFFTTKPTGQGTGLGLAVSRQIMEMHGGTLDIQNNELGVLARLVFKSEAREA